VAAAAAHVNLNLKACLLTFLRPGLQGKRVLFIGTRFSNLYTERDIDLGFMLGSRDFATSTGVRVRRVAVLGLVYQHMPPGGGALVPKLTREAGSAAGGVLTKGCWWVE